MIHRESIPIENYTNEFEIPYLAEFADTFRKCVVKSGVKNCFCLKLPLYLPGESKAVNLLFQKKSNASYECHVNQHIVLYTPNLPDFDLKSQILKGFQFTREWDDEIGKVYFYGIHVTAKIFSQMDLDFSFRNLITDMYRISDNGIFDHCLETTRLCQIYDVEDFGDKFAVTLPNINSKYSIRKFFDFVQFLCAVTNFSC